MKTNLKKQSGFTLIEAMITISIFAILITIAVPSFKETVSTRNLNSSTLTLIQIIKSSQKMAHAENTYVSISIDKHNITVTKQNNNEQKDTALPRQIKAKNEVTITINPIGHIVTGTSPNYEAATEDTTMELQFTGNTDTNKTITISPTGYVSS